MNEPFTDVAKEPEPDRVLLNIRLDMHVHEFEPRRGEFIRQLASSFGIPPSEVIIVSIRSGCTQIDVSLPKREAEELLNSIEDRNSPLWAGLRQLFRVRRVRHADSIDAFDVIIDRANWDSSRTLTWLHLSDLNIRADSGEARGAQERTLHNFVQGLPDTLRKAKLAPNILFITGNLSHSGLHPEFIRVASFIRDTQAKLPKLSSVFAVPGPSDLDSANVTTEAADQAPEQLSSDAFFGMPEHKLLRDSALQGFGAFLNFLKHETSQKLGLTHESFYISELQHRDLQIGIAGLPSAWFSPHGPIAMLGRTQILAATDQLGSPDFDLKIALTYYSPISDSFSKADFVAQQQHLPPGFDFVLHGQGRPARVRYVGPPSNVCTLMATGAIIPRDSSPRRFQIVRLSLDTATIQTFFWKASEESEAHWVPDAEYYAPTGFYETQVSERLRHRIWQRSSSAG